MNKNECFNPHDHNSNDTSSKGKSKLVGKVLKVFA